MPLGRRAILAAFAVSAQSGAQAQPRDGTPGMTDARLRTSTWLAAWDAQGTHRTATAGDETGAAWLASEAGRLGGRVEIERFALDRIDPIHGFVEIDSQQIQGVGMFDAPDTPAGGIEGLASTPSGAGLVALTDLSPLVVYTAGFGQMRRSTPARAIVAVTQGGAPGLALLNAEAFRQPFGPAILQVPSEAGAMLAAAFARGAAFRVVVETRRVPAQARNVLVTVPGRDPARPPVVVMTPRSSWWQSTSERGGGLVCWLEALRALIAQPPACDVVFTANSGHELGHIGLDDFIERRPGWRTAATWVHYGANIGATASRLAVVSPNKDVRALVSAAFTRGDVPAALAPEDTVPNGESRDIHRDGGRYFTLVGSNPLFHLPQDRYPDAVDIDAIARIAAASAQIVVALTR